MTKAGPTTRSSSPAAAETLASAMASSFQVSKQAALIRIGTLQIATIS